jgi:rhodanese-related sulfurtransferase
MCCHGERATAAAGALAASGRRDMTVLKGGHGDWARADGRLTTGA